MKNQNAQYIEYNLNNKKLPYGGYAVVHYRLANAFECGDKALVFSILVGIHNYTFKQCMMNREKYNGEFFHTHEQIKEKLPYISSHIITGTIKKAEELGLLTKTFKRGKDYITRNFYQIQQKEYFSIISKKTILKTKKRDVSKIKKYPLNPTKK